MPRKDDAEEGEIEDVCLIDLVSMPILLDEPACLAHE